MLKILSMDKILCKLCYICFGTRWRTSRSKYDMWADRAGHALAQALGLAAMRKRLQTKI